jgi:hypothetical protein
MLVILWRELLHGPVTNNYILSVAVHVRSRKKFDHNEFIEHIRSINGILEASIAE